ncbi:menaquinone biosynthetic enzyme MqnA/MqnD family protein [Pelotomaculum propionicicum]|uniref:Chorismate dehydratase n=1 Tax=Pelotomaculum propionicicum TaxID=258475 RepID=A0A4Y7RPE9_9FIRM|nr:menaquinone biosynthesis protein [Pelotomaculum propionicicum]NLI13866.1 menaquinone biosynthesis protein [Peptococcaceae bacterium]TEB10733.1 Chorismate dehydratase [Pelotomaculum propionicicum]
MVGIRMGRVDCINCLPVYHALEEGLLSLPAELVRGPANRLNRLFFSGKLNITLMSSIDYARNAERCLILPDLSICSDGRAGDFLLFSKVPVTELEGKKVFLSRSSADSVTLLKVLLDHYYQVDVQYKTTSAGIDRMMAKADGAFLVGSEAMLARLWIEDAGLPYFVTDLGEAWQQFSGEKPVCALWVVGTEYAGSNAQAVELVCKTLIQARQAGLSRMPEIIDRAQKEYGLPRHLIEEYFNATTYNFDAENKRALLTFYDYAYKSGLVDDRVKIRIWGE